MNEETICRTVKILIVHFPGVRTKDFRNLMNRLRTLAKEISVFMTRYARRTLSELERAWQDGEESLRRSAFRKASPTYKNGYSLFMNQKRGIDKTMYPYTTDLAAGGVRSQAVRIVNQWIDTHFYKVAYGQERYPLWGGKGNPVIPLRFQEVSPHDNDGRLWNLTLLARTSGKPFTVRLKPNGGQQAILSRMLTGVYKRASSEMIYDKRKNRWFLTFAYHMPKKRNPQDGESIVVGVDLGRKVYAKCVAVKVSNPKTIVAVETMEVPLGTRGLKTRLEREKRQRAQTCQDKYALREGRGRVRKMRPVEQIRNNLVRVQKDGERKAAAALERWLQSLEDKGFSIRLVVLEDLKHFWERNQQRIERSGKSNKGKARARKYELWNRNYALRQAFKDNLEKNGRMMQEIPPAMTSQTCAKCGVEKEKGERLALSDRTFECGHCKWKRDRDLNAAMVIAQRGLAQSTHPARKAKRSKPSYAAAPTSRRKGESPSKDRTAK